MEHVQAAAAVEAGREDEEAVAGIKAEGEAYQKPCAKGLEAAEPVIAEVEAARLSPSTRIRLER